MIAPGGARGWVRATRTRTPGLYGCLLLALAARLTAAVLVSHPEMRHGAFDLGADEPSFHDTAVALATTGSYARRPGGPPTAFRPPLAILPLAAAYLVWPSPWVGFGVVLLWSLGVVVLAARVGAVLSDDPRVPLVAAFLAATMPTLVFTGSGIWSEPQAILLNLFVLLLLIRDPGAVRTARDWAVVGFCLALTYLTRQSGGFLLPVVVVGAWWTSARPRRAANAIALVVAFLLPVAVWGVRNRVTMGEVVLSASVSGQALWGSNNPVTAGVAPPALPERRGYDLLAEAREGRYLGSWVPMAYIPGWNPGPSPSELDIFHLQIASTRAFFRSHPAAVLQLLRYKLTRLLTAEPYAPSISGDAGTRRLIHREATRAEYWLLLVTGGMGLLIVGRSRRHAARWCAAFFAAGVANVLVAYPNPRFLLPATTILLAPAAVALVYAYHALRRMKPPDLLWTSGAKGSTTERDSPPP